MATCSNRLLTIAKMEQELEDTMSSALETCVNVYDYSNDLNVADEWVLDVDIFQQTVDVTLTYPVEIVKDEEDQAKQEEFQVSLDYPLGELYDVAMDIVNSEASIGDFDQLLYMLQKLSRYNIYKHRPYPDVLYQLKLREDDYIFQFSIQGEELV